MPKSAGIRVPRTKRELRDKILSYGFSGDFRELAPDPKQVRIRPIGSNAIEVDFLDADLGYQIVIRRPRGENQRTSVSLTQGKVVPKTANKKIVTTEVEPEEPAASVVKMRKRQKVSA